MDSSSLVWTNCCLFLKKKKPESFYLKLSANMKRSSVLLWVLLCWIQCVYSVSFLQTQYACVCVCVDGLDGRLQKQKNKWYIDAIDCKPRTAAVSSIISRYTSNIQSKPPLTAREHQSHTIWTKFSLSQTNLVQYSTFLICFATLQFH